MDDDVFDVFIREQLRKCAPLPDAAEVEEAEAEEAVEAEEAEEAVGEREVLSVDDEEEADSSTWGALHAVLRTMVRKEVKRQLARRRRHEEDMARVLHIFKTHQGFMIPTTASTISIEPMRTGAGVPLPAPAPAPAPVPAPAPAPVPAPAPAPCVSPPDSEPTPSLTLREQAKLRSVADSGKYALVYDAAVAKAAAHMQFTRPRKFFDSSGAGITGRINRRR